MALAFENEMVGAHVLANLVAAQTVMRILTGWIEAMLLVSILAVLYGVHVRDWALD